MNLYTKRYFNKLFISTYNAAIIILKELYKIYQFKSIVDIGCGHGSWLKAASQIIPNGRIYGVDGIYTKELHTNIKADFKYINLEKKFTINKFDLAISLETAEHLSPERAKSFIKDICNTSDVVFFSAAVDGHGGVNHLNEKNQSYWIKLFNDENYHPFIFLDRNKYWYHKSFKKCPYYISGSFLYIKKGTRTYQNLIKYKLNKNDLTDIIHPYILQWRKDENFGVKLNFRRLIKSLILFLKRKLNF